ncbi:hypothetical protein AAMO2058_000203400 [Amorphochlora amoebiformis]|uniref:Uncharacterized protein n=1 Tax=Amorphochlora amoebiformis TaxID=1561963 RepID=A0A7S0CST8_9EUKA|mmetsp:Transcript_12042/g.19133  ORF Transcript_12042/g.19133 Transcript_12042/m.19133 type:complete len:148 (+) Transcript_12042:126-569(+)
MRSRVAYALGTAILLVIVSMSTRSTRGNHGLASEFLPSIIAQKTSVEPNFFPYSESDAKLLHLYSQWWWHKYLEYYNSGEILKWWQRQNSPQHPNPHVHVLQQIAQMKAMHLRNKVAASKKMNGTRPADLTTMVNGSNDTSTSPSIL